MIGGTMELRQLSTFCMVARMMSFSRAAEALGYVQSSITAQMQGLEEELGVRLFDRLGKRVALTDAGRRLLTYAEKMLDMADEARNAVKEDREELTGTVTISAPESLCTYRLPAVLQRFRMRFPQARLIFRSASFEEVRRLVSEGMVDIAFSIDEPLHSMVLNIETLIREPLCMLAAPDHPLARISNLQAEDLQGIHFLLTEKGCTYRNLFDRALSEAGIDAVTDLEFTSVEAIKQCVIAGMGVTFLPEFTVAREIEQGQLVALRWEQHDFHVLTQVFWHKEKWLSPTTMAFLQCVRETMTRQPLACN
jgi:DNA-binding transcriptional LysR family regulator